MYLTILLLQILKMVCTKHCHVKEILTQSSNSLVCLIFGKNIQNCFLLIKLIKFQVFLEIVLNLKVYFTR